MKHPSAFIGLAAGLMVGQMTTPWLTAPVAFVVCVLDVLITGGK